MVDPLSIVAIARSSLMIRIFFISIVLSLAATIAFAQDTYRYVPGTEDIPVYQGLVENKEARLLYDVVEGNIVDTLFEGDASSYNNIKHFYEETLPQIGWKKVKYQIYERGDERLELDYSLSDNKIMLQFSLRPKK